MATTSYGMKGSDRQIEVKSHIPKGVASINDYYE